MPSRLISFTLLETMPPNFASILWVPDESVHVRHSATRLGAFRSFRAFVSFARCLAFSALSDAALSRRPQRCLFSLFKGFGSGQSLPLRKLGFSLTRHEIHLQPPKVTHQS